jgi:hypothetical protein
MPAGVMPHQLPTDDLLVLGGDSVSARQVPDLARAVAGAMEAHERFTPTRAGTREPLRNLRGGFLEFTETELAKSAGRPFRILYGRPDPVLHGTLDIFTDTTLDRRPRTHVIDAGIPLATLDPDGRDAFVAWALDLFDALEVLHGFVTTSDMQAQRKGLISEATERGEMAAPLWSDPLYTSLDRVVSDVYWVNYFGPAFVDRWGPERFAATGARLEERSGGAVALWAAGEPPALDPAVRRLADYPFKQPFYAALGREAFTRESPDMPEPGQHVPTLHEHRARTGSAPARSRAN